MADKDKQRFSEQRLDEAIGQLPREIMPERDLWAQMQHRLPEREKIHTSVFRKIYGQHLTALLVLSLAGLLGWRLMLLPETESLNDHALNEQSAETSLVETFEQYKANQLADVQPINEQFGNWQQQLNIWDDAIGQVRMALSFYPDEPVLVSQLGSLYQQQMNYLQLISSVDTQYQLMGEIL